MEAKTEQIVENIVEKTSNQIRGIAESSEDRVRELYEKEERNYPFEAYFSGFILTRLVDEIEENLEE